MAAPISPAKKTSNGRDTWWLVPAGTNKAAPTVAEVNSASGLNIVGFLMKDYGGITSSTDKVTLPSVLLETEATQVNGETTHSAEDMQITFDPQAAVGSNGKKGFALLDGGTFSGWAVRRQDFAPANAKDTTAGEFVDVVPVSIGQPIPGKTSTGADGIYICTAAVSITGVPAWNKAVVA